MLAHDQLGDRTAAAVGRSRVEVRDAQRPESGPLRPDGSILADKRHNPFAAAH